MNNFHNCEWPPPYTLKKHPLARRVKLRISPRKGLELITPLRFNLKHIPKILEQHRTWIEKQFSALQKTLAEKAQETQLPETIVLNAMNQTWKVLYMASDTPLKLILRPHQELVLLGDIKNIEECQKLLMNWSKKQAKKHLLSQINLLSDQLKLPITKVSIRDQQSRWGSCSSKKAISLNYKLIFLPANLVEHTLIHELCHTVHLNHSAHFWQLVQSFDQNSEQHRRDLRKANQFIPSWLPNN